MAVVLASCMRLGHRGAEQCRLLGVGYPSCLGEGRGVWQGVDGGLGGRQDPLWLFRGV